MATASVVGIERWSAKWLRWGAIAGIVGAVLGVVGLALSQSSYDTDGELFRQSVDGDGYVVAYLIVGAAVVLASIGLMALCSAGVDAAVALGRRFLVVGVTVALLEEWGLQPALRTLVGFWIDAPTSDATSAFWAAEAVFRVDTFMQDVWQFVLFGILPLLIARSVGERLRMPAWVSYVLWLAGLLVMFLAVLDIGGSSWDLSVVGQICVLVFVAWLALGCMILLRSGGTNLSLETASTSFSDERPPDLTAP